MPGSGRRHRTVSCLLDLPENAEIDDVGDDDVQDVSGGLGPDDAHHSEKRVQQEEERNVQAELADGGQPEGFPARPMNQVSAML